MRFEPLSLKGAYRIIPKRIEDDRGHFRRTFCRRTMAKNSLEDCAIQCSLSYNRLRGTLRGMHFQTEPHAETKIVRCSRGAIYDAIVDIRIESPTYGQWVAETLTAENGIMLYIPQGFAHGFLTLMDHTEVDYQMAEEYVPGYAAGFLWNDEDIGIEWPESPVLINKFDRGLPKFDNLNK